MEEVADLVLNPFRDMVEKGTVALGNAKDADSTVSGQMAKAAQNLVKEGERALKRIEPLCRKQVEKYGSNFVDALKENDEIAGYRTELMDLLWDFDDYIEADEFDAGKFAELQALSRKAAPRIPDILMRMKIEVPVIDISNSPRPSVATTASGTFDQMLRPELGQVEAKQESNPSRDVSANQDMVQSEGAELRNSMGAQSGPDLGLDARIPRSRTPSDDNGRSSSRSSQLPPVYEPAPPEPPADPWQRVPRPPTQMVDQAQNLEVIERRNRLSVAVESPIDPAFPATFKQETVMENTPRQAPEEFQGRLRSDSDASSLASFSNYNTSTANFASGAAKYQPPSTGVNAPFSPDAIQPHRRDTSQMGMVNGRGLPPVPETSSVERAWRESQASSRDSRQGSVFDARGDDVASGVISPLAANRMSNYSIVQSPVAASNLAGQDTRASQPHMDAVIPSGREEEQPGLEIVPVIKTDYSDGLIPVVETEPEVERIQGTPLPPLPTRAIGLDSSFFHHKGLCAGAREVLNGGVGVKKVKKVGLGAPVIVAKCKNCMYELEWKAVEDDLNVPGNYQIQGVAFRLRFLSKSHLATSFMDEQLYGCIFCVQIGHTTEESDATVFFSQKQLFAHLARHPRPLPHVPGLIVAEGNDISETVRDNYDLCFLKSPKPTATPLADRGFQDLPTATTWEAYRAMNGIFRLAPDSARPLQLAPKAKIVGIEFPERYKGEWAMGWADNEYSAFPLYVVRFDPPPKRLISMQGTSSLSVIARWKWNPKNKEGTEWLTFSKGDMISNIGWAYKEHWCWSGTNSRGKWGIFPSAFIDPRSLSDGRNTDRASVHSRERKLSVLSRISLRSRGGSAGYEHDLQRSASPRPSIY